jgi:hypothetical protein
MANRKVALTLTMCFVVPFFAYLVPLGRAKPFRRAAFDDLIVQIRGGVFQPDRQGVVTLPRNLTSLSATGDVYVRRWPSGRLIIFVPSRVGRRTLLINRYTQLISPGDYWLQGYIYDSQSETGKPQGAGSEDDGCVIAPPPGPPWMAAHQGHVELRLLSYRRRITEHWCYADIFS